MSERCLMGVHPAGPPRLPGVYGNFNQIVQTNGLRDDPERDEPRCPHHPDQSAAPPEPT